MISFLGIFCILYFILLPTSRVKSQEASSSVSVCDRSIFATQNGFTPDPLDDIYDYRCTVTTDFYGNNSAIPTHRTVCIESRRKEYDKNAKQWIIHIQQESCNKSTRAKKEAMPSPDWHPPLTMSNWTPESGDGERVFSDTPVTHAYATAMTPCRDKVFNYVV